MGGGPQGTGAPLLPRYGSFGSSSSSSSVGWPPRRMSSCAPLSPLATCTRPTLAHNPRAGAASLVTARRVSAAKRDRLLCDDEDAHKHAAEPPAAWSASIVGN